MNNIEKEKEYLANRKKLIYDMIEKSEEAKELIQIQDAESINFDKDFCNPEVCKMCMGRCCNTAPCKFSPNDFLDVDNFDYMKKLFDLGILCIEVDDEDNMVIRPRGEHDKGIITVPYNYNSCSLLLWDEEAWKCSCVLEADYRPLQGLLYLAESEAKHHALYSKDQIKADWNKHKEILEKLYKYYKDDTVKTDAVPSEERILTYKKLLTDSNI